jgi:hypothetical protein
MKVFGGSQIFLQTTGARGHGTPLLSHPHLLKSSSILQPGGHAEPPKVYALKNDILLPQGLQPQ